MDRGESLLSGLLSKVRGLIVTEPMRDRLQYFKRDPGFQVVLGLRDGFQLLLGRHHRLIAVHRACLALGICLDLRKEAGPVEVEVGREVLLIEGIHEWGPTLRKVALAKEFPDHGPILTFHEGVLVSLTGAGRGAVDQEFAEKARHAPIDVFRAIV